MPAFVVPGGAQIRIVWACSGQTLVNVFGGLSQGSGTVSQATADAVRDIIVGAYASSGLAPLQTTQVAIQRVGIRDVSTPNNAEYESAVTGTGGTDAASDTLPRSAAVVVTFKTARAGKSFRGRSYMAGFAETQNATASVIAATAATASTAFWDAIRNNLPTAGYVQSILSPALPARPNHDGSAELPAKTATNTAVTTALVRSLEWGSQRRRNHRP